MTSPVLALDFGTSNSAAAILENGQVRPIAIEGDEPTLPTAVFLPASGGQMLIGRAAARALIEGEEGRYMRALKSVLGTALFHESRLIAGRRRSVADVVTAFLRELRLRAEAATGLRFTAVRSGRPVHFHTRAPERDAQALTDLHGCYLAAGFTDVTFMAEPEAAAFAACHREQAELTGLIVDIGGGTSDFTVFRQQAGGGIEILASHGIRLGGTDFDHSVSMAHAMPLLGLDGQLKREFGDGLLPVPRAIHVDLSTWAMIPFLYTRETERETADMLRHAVDRPAMTRLHQVITEQLGHDLAFAVERGKIAANDGQPAARIDMAMIEKGLGATITRGSLNASLADSRPQLQGAIYETLMRAATSPAQIDRMVLVGGSSLLAMVEDEARAICPTASLDHAAVFTAVVDGLALAG